MKNKLFYSFIILSGIMIFGYTNSEAIESVQPDYHVTAQKYEANDKNEASKDITVAEIAKTGLSNEKIPLNLEISSKYAVLYDATNKRILFEKNSEKRCYPASTTKLLTAAAVAEFCPKDYEFKVGDEISAIGENSSVAGLKKGNVLSKSDIIEAMLIPSGNDAAYTAAANMGRLLSGIKDLPYKRAVKIYCDKMNEILGLIGANNTHFANPDGYHDPNHYTTAEDMLKIVLYAKEFDIIENTVSKSIVNEKLLSGETMQWKNSNALICKDNKHYYPKATGLKTGLTSVSGYCVTASAEMDGTEIIAVVLGGQTSDKRWDDTVLLLNEGFYYTLGYCPDELEVNT